MLDTWFTPCPVHHGVGKGCCPPSSWPHLDAVAKQQSCISLAAPLPPSGTSPGGVCGGFSCQSSPGHSPTEPWEISSVLLGKQVVAVSSGGLSAMASLRLWRGRVGGLSLVISISKGTAVVPCSPLGPPRTTALRRESLCVVRAGAQSERTAAEVPSARLLPSSG